jgi:integrase
MADIDKRGGKWVARWRDADRKQRWKTFDRKIDADRFLTAVLADLQRGTYIDPRAGAVPLGEYATGRWLPAQVHIRRNTAETYTSHLSTWIVPLLGDRRVGAIRRPDVVSFVAALRAEGLAPSTIATIYAVLRAVMGSAKADGLIPANPCEDVPLPRVEQRVVEPLPAAAVLALAAAITARYELSVWLGAGLGLRLGEATGLTLPRVDFLRRNVHVVQQMQGRRLSPLKTRASQRVVPADDLVLQKTAAHVERWPPGEHGVLITNRLGQPVQRNSFGDRWRLAVREAGLPAGTRFHDLRHFYASTLIAAGAHPKVVQERLGHATMAETMDTYSHLFPAAADTGRGALDAALGTHPAHKTGSTRQ